MVVPETEIIVSRDGVELARRVVPPGDYVIGRDPGCELPLEVELVSRRHAQLTVNYDHVLIEDLGSSNGTFVNGQAVTKPTRLWPNQKIQIGVATLELRRVKTLPLPEASLDPGAVAVQRLLPEEFLRDRKYDIGGVVAQGGMGAILDVRDAATQRRVAMKVMLDGSSPDDLTRFVAEARVTSQLEHPSIVPIYELSVDENGQPFYTMKMVRGITLKKVLELLAKDVPETVAKYPLPALLTIFQKVCDALAFAHSRGVIHRDLKPENLMLDDFGVVLVMDWGLAKIVGKKESTADAGRPSSIHTLPPEASGATLAGTIMGTPAFMSPEQARGEVDELDARSDLYALGAILYQILALRPPVSGRSAMEIVDKVQRGEIEPLVAAVDGRGQSLRHLPGGRIPDSLAAVVGKAMAFDKAARYATVADLQRDLEAYQNGRATSAENASLGKHLLLGLKRHKIAAAGLAAVLLVGATFGTKAVVEGRRAERALADLKASAPALLQLAESEADSQRFPSALGKLDAALALDPALRRARWQRAWVLLALERWSEASDALRLANEHDPANAKLASILLTVEQVAAAPEAARWKSDAAREVFAHLQTVEATGPALAFSGKLKLNAEERRKLADQRLLAALGKGSYTMTIGSDGLVAVSVSQRPLRSLEAIRGLPIESLNAQSTLITDLEPLRGMRLQVLRVMSTKVADLSPLQGMPLRQLIIGSTAVNDLFPLTGMKLEYFSMAGCKKVNDLAPLAGMPLTEIDISTTVIPRIDALRGMPLSSLNAGANQTLEDYSPLKGAPIETLLLGGTIVSDLSFVIGMPLRSLQVGASRVSNIEALRGLPLEDLDLHGTSITDLSALQGAPLKTLKLRGCKKLTDYTAILTLPRLERLSLDVLPAALLPLRESATLQSIEADAYPGEGSQGARPVAEFWRAYDAHQAAGKK